MNKKFYTAPNVDIVELQGEVVLTNGSNVNDASDPCGGMSLDPWVLLVTTEIWILAHTSTYGRMNDRSVSS